MKTRHIAAAAAILLLAGCTGGDPTPTATSTPSETATADGALTCVLADDGATFTLEVSGSAERPVDYIGDVSIEAQGEVVGSVYVAIRAVQPGEHVMESGTTGVTGADACGVEGISVTELAAPSVGAADVSECLDVAPSSANNFSYALDITNNSTDVAAEYSIAVAFRDTEGTRRASRLVLAAYDTGDWTAVAPGETVTQNDETLGVTYAADWTCEVVYVSKQTQGEFFSVEDGVSTGSIDADVAFASGSAELTDDALVLLQTAIEPLQTTSGPVCIAGYADSVGEEEANRVLSQERADAVAEYLRSVGVTADLDTMGWGESEADADDLDDPDLRRVEITLDTCV